MSQPENRIIVAPQKHHVKAGNILVNLKNKSDGEKKQVVIESRNPDVINPRDVIPKVLPGWEVVKVMRLVNAKSIKTKKKPE